MVIGCDIYFIESVLAVVAKKSFSPQGCYIKGYKNIFIGNNVSWGVYSQIYATGTGKERIKIGKNVGFNSNVMINADMGGEIIIGDNVRVGPNVVFRACNHVFFRRDIPIREQGHEAGRIIAKEDVWIGANVTILPDVIIGKGAIIAAGTVVNKDVEDFTVVGGVPAKEIGVRG